VSKRSAPVVTRACNGKGSRSAAGVGLFRKGRRCRQTGLRQWLYATKPVFARLTHSLAEAFDVAEEVRLVLDLGGFRPGDIRLEISPERYFIAANHNSMSFAEEIPLPEAVDISMKEEHFKDGILQLVLPRKAQGVPAWTGKGNDGQRPNDSGHR